MMADTTIDVDLCFRALRHNSPCKSAIYPMKALSYIEYGKSILVERLEPVISDSWNALVWVTLSSIIGEDCRKGGILASRVPDPGGDDGCSSL